MNHTGMVSQCGDMMKRVCLLDILRKVEQITLCHHSFIKMIYPRFFHSTSAHPQVYYPIARWYPLPIPHTWPLGTVLAVVPFLPLTSLHHIPRAIPSYTVTTLSTRDQQSMRTVRAETSLIPGRFYRVKMLFWIFPLLFPIQSPHATRTQ